MKSLNRIWLGVFCLLLFVPSMVCAQIMTGGISDQAKIIPQPDTWTASKVESIDQFANIVYFTNGTYIRTTVERTNLALMALYTDSIMAVHWVRSDRPGVFQYDLIGLQL